MQQAVPGPSTAAYNHVELFQTKVKNGYKTVFEAQALDSQGNIDAARDLYYRASSQLTRALSMRAISPQLVEERRKANFILNMIKERIRELEDFETPKTENDESDDLSYLLDNIDDIDSILSGEQEAKEILQIDSGISVFNVKGTGEVEKTKSDAAARIKHIITPNSTSPISCLQIGELVYPLISKASPVLQVGEKQFMFPSLQDANKYIGVVLENVDSKKIEDFQKLIMSLTNLQVKSWDDVIADDAEDEAPQEVKPSAPRLPPARPPPPSDNTLANKPYLRPDPVEPRTVDKVSNGIQVTADILSAGVVWGSRVGGDLIRKGANSIKGRIKPSSRNVEISENTREQVTTLRESTYQVSILTGQAVVQLANGISALAKLIAPHVTKGVKTLIQNSDNKLVNDGKKRISEQNIKDVCQLAMSGLSGLSTLYDGLEEGAKNLGRALAEGANVTIGQRYGADAGQLAEDSVHTVTNVGLTYSQARKLTGKAVAKRAAKSTAKEVVVSNVVKKS